jgi:glycosyltransferase involved in cell wall biosynthesis
MRIAHLTTVHARDDTRIFRKMCRSLAAAGHDVELHVADGRGPDTVDGVRIVDAGRPSSRATRATLTAARLWWRALRSEPDVLHFHDPELIPGGIVARLAGRPVVYDIHEYYRTHLRETAALPRVVSALVARAYGVAERCAATCLDACVVVTPHMQRVLPLRRSVVVANHVRAEEFRPGPLPAADRPTSVCYVGVLSAPRMVEGMVDAAAAAAARLVLAGTWYPQGYRAAVAARPGWSTVDELGQIDRERMQQVFDASRAGLLIVDLHGDEAHSSNNKLFEYMAAGLPVIASDIHFAREIVDRHGCGLIVSPASDPRAVAAAIDWIISHPDDADHMGRAGRRAVDAEYSWERERERLLGLYESLSSAGRRR